MSSIVEFQVCRTAYCKECYERGDPHFGQWYAVFGSHTQLYYIGFATHNSTDMKRGYTPHLFIKKKTFEGNVEYERMCMMHQCGIQIWNPKAKQIMVDMDKIAMIERGLDGRPLCYKDLAIHPLHWKKGNMMTQHWNALVLFFHGWTGYQLTI